MFTYDKNKKYTEWVEFSKDEKYLIEYFASKDYISTKADKMDSEFARRILNWSGIFVPVDGGNVALDYSADNVTEVFIKNYEQPDVAERVVFLMNKMTSPETFFNAGKKEKN